MKRKEYDLCTIKANIAMLVENYNSDDFKFVCLNKRTLEKKIFQTFSEAEASAIENCDVLVNLSNGSTLNYVDDFIYSPVHKILVDEFLTNKSKKCMKKGSFVLSIKKEERTNCIIHSIMLNNKHVGEWNDRGNVLFDIVTLNALLKTNLSVEAMKEYLLDNYSN